MKIGLQTGGPTIRGNLDRTMMMKITYEFLFDLLRAEREKRYLQELDKTFYQDIVEYMKSMNRHSKEFEMQKRL